MNFPLSKSAAGFTLIELVVVIVIVGILVALGGQLIVGPVTGYVDLARRTRLTDEADQSLRRMQRDLRQALPNSIRIAGGGKYLELLHTTDGGRYRRYPDPGAGGDDILDFAGSDASFDVLGELRAAPTVNDVLVIYNFSPSGAAGNAYQAAAQNRASIAAGSSSSQIRLDPAYQFVHRSPYQRFYIVDEPVTYACEGEDLIRYADYGIHATQQTSGLGSGALVTRGVADCNFSFDAGSGHRAGLVTLKLSLEHGGESVALLQQIHILNAP